MRKIAVFVEGLTEQEFTVALVTELVGSKGLHVALEKQFKGMVTITPVSPPVNADFYVLIVDCAADGQVKTQINDQYNSLIAAGYSSIIGLRDVFPFTSADIQQLSNTLNMGLPSIPIKPKMLLAVMEIEAWFLAEKTHFPRINPALTVQNIVANGFDIQTTSADSWPNPADTLHRIYKLAQAAYASKGKKSRRRIIRTIKSLSFESLYIDIRQQLQDLNEYISALETALY